MYSHLCQLCSFPSNNLTKSRNEAKISKKVKIFPIISRLLSGISSHFNSKVCNLRRSKALKKSFPDMYSHLCQLYFFPWNNLTKSRNKAKISKKLKNFPIISRLLSGISSHFNSKVCNLRRSKALKKSFPDMYSHLYHLYFFPSNNLTKLEKKVKIWKKVKHFPNTSRSLPAISHLFNSKVCGLRRWKAL